MILKFDIVCISLVSLVYSWCPGYLDILTEVTCENGLQGVCPPFEEEFPVTVNVIGPVKEISTSLCAPYREWTCSKNPYKRPACRSPKTFRIPANPSFAASTIQVGLGFERGESNTFLPAANISQEPFQGTIGVLITGVPIYSVATKLSKVLMSGIASEKDGFVDVREGASHLEDFCGGFTDEDGVYHIHRLPRRVVWAQRGGDRDKCALPHDDQTPPGMHSNLLGYMLDGFAIYGPRNPQGEPTRDLDECGGHAGHATEEDGPTDYHYHFTDEYPFSIECFRGCPLVNSGNSDLDRYALTCVSA